MALDVTNTGSIAGADVVQLYVAAPASASEPPHQLKGFVKVSLSRGERKHISLTLDRRAFSVWNTAAKQWRVADGTHEILIGDSSRNLPLHGVVEIRGSVH